ncbi:DUF4266 domain-containing protein [Nannocystis radixulma]|uniref:DUF4266 domain-containing protein n=1 Tax=Nannocystis radixulma TaxID=2995305 RepID=A0ABT5BBY1_9BACT|nr:DUF4266 domain-containing protein [Nannocystis radixulma]MDC0671642.1 DUF4266 domain-containing protein [Nannocystis radixulma]
MNRRSPTSRASESLDPGHCRPTCPEDQVASRFRPARRAPLLSAFLLALAALAPAAAAAYSTPALYNADPARTGGAGGRIFSGSPGDGFTCAVCHTGGPAPTPEIKGGPGGAYKPGATYMFEVTWPEDVFGIVLEATDPSGAPLGTLRLPPPDILTDDELCPGGRAAEWIEFPEGDPRQAVAVNVCGSHRLRVQWTAPDAHLPGAIYMAAVAADDDGTPAGDGAAAWEFPVGPPAAAEGCAVAGSTPWWALLLLTRRRRRAAALLGALSLGTGCARVQPYERGRLAQPDMQLNGDGDLNAGPEHALDYREGSAGGLGGGGGGCGCN